MASVSHNPHVRYQDITRRGYVLHTVTPKAWTAQIRLVANTLVAKSPTANGPKITIRAGAPGVADIA